MTSMIRRDLFASIPALITAFFFVLISYAINVSPLFTTISVVILLILILFHYDFHNSVYRFIASLPISREKIVLARFIVAGSIALFFISFIWIFDIFVHTYIYPRFSGYLGGLEFEPLSPILVLFACLAIVSVISVSMPIYYYAQSIAKAIIIQLVLFLLIIVASIFSMFSSLLEKLLLNFLDLINAVPTLSIISYIILSLCASYFLSVRFFRKRDIA